MTKWHAFGVLEYFRKTELPNISAWKVVHRIASKFSVNDVRFQSVLSRLVYRYLEEFAAISSTGHQDFAEHTREFYWLVVLVMVLGEEALEETEDMQELKKM